MSVIRTSGSYRDPTMGPPGAPVFVHWRNEQLIERVVAIKRCQEAEATRLVTPDNVCESHE